jgi:hypothetical protein
MKIDFATSIKNGHEPSFWDLRPVIESHELSFRRETR